MHTSGVKEAAEKGRSSSKKAEKHTSGAKARVDSIGLMPGINPRPTARMSFSASCKVAPRHFEFQIEISTKQAIPQQVKF
jgi:hypothetical protein